MSDVGTAVERFAQGRHVLLGDDSGSWVVVAASTVNADRLERLADLGDGTTTLALADVALHRVGLLRNGRTPRSLGASGAGDDRARTMRAAAAGETGAGLLTPGHVALIRIDADARGIAAAHLATLAGAAPAVALSAVVDEHGHALPLAVAMRRPDLAFLPAVAAAQLAAADPTPARAA